MRRLAVLPLLVLALVVAGCNSGSTTRRTVTVLSSVTASAPASAPKTTGSVIVVGPTGTPKPTPTTKKTTPQPTPTTKKPTAAPIVKVDPLQADCGTILDAADIKAAIGATVVAAHNRIRLGAADRGVTGAIRCLYGSTDNGKTAPVRIRLTQYGTAAAAKKQVSTDAQQAMDDPTGSAVVTNTTVNGYPASLQLLGGGLIELTYGTWTLSLAVSDKLTSNAKLTAGLPNLAGQVLTRIIKNA